MQGQAVLRSLSSRRACYPMASNIWKPAFFRRMTMWEFSSSGPSQKPSGSKQVDQTKTLTRRNVSKKALEALLEDLQILLQHSVGSQSCYCSLEGSHPSFDPLEPAMCVRWWIALHWLTFGMLVCAALSAFSVVSSRYCVVFRELSKPSGTFQTRDTYSFFIFFIVRIRIFNCFFCDLLAGCLFCKWHFCFHYSLLVAWQSYDGQWIGEAFSVLKNLLQKSGCG